MEFDGKTVDYLKMSISRNKRLPSVSGDTRTHEIGDRVAFTQILECCLDPSAEEVV